MTTSVSAQDIEFFSFQKLALLEALKSGTSFTSKPTHGKVGIINQGATCYLNTLLQCLYNDSVFRTIVHSSEGNALVLKELKRLFAFLSLSETSAISSVDLVAGFGWSKSQAFEQHDVHELFSVLIDALGKVSTELNDKIKGLFEGVTKETIKCPSCSYEGISETAFLNLSIDLPDKLESGEAGASVLSVSLSDLLIAHVKPEILDIDNQWQCSGCDNKVQAKKFLQYVHLPDCLFIHLKRFRFDPTTRRRRKLTTAVTFPFSLDSALLLPGNKSSDYVLTGVLIHTGTAMGGHYRAFLKSENSETWFDFNDSIVTELSKEEVRSLFYVPSPDSIESPRASHYRGLLHENAYMLVYGKASAAAASKGATVGPQAAFADEVATANEDYVNLKKAFDIQQKLAEFSVYFKCKVDPASVGKTLDYEQQISDSCYVSSVSLENSRAKVSLHVDSSKTLKFALTKAFDALCSCGITDHPYSHAVSGVGNCRLRQYNEISNRLGETFGDREDSSIASIGLLSTSTTSCISLILETRQDYDPPFTEYNPREMIVNLIRWEDVTKFLFPSGNFNIQDVTLKLTNMKEDAASEVDGLTVTASSSLTTSGISTQIIRTSLPIPGEDKATVAGLRQEVKKFLGLGNRNDVKVALIHHSDRATVELNEESKFLRKDFGMWPGDEIIVEVISSEDFQSNAFLSFKNSRKAIHIMCNNVLEENSSSSSYEVVVETSLDASLTDLKTAIATRFNISSPDLFYLRRSAIGPQLKDESLTIEQSDLVDYSMVHIQMGKGCAMDEYLLHFDLDISNITANAKSVSQDTAEQAQASDFTSGGIASSQKKAKSTTSNDYLSLGDLGIQERLSVFQLKQVLTDRWNDLISSSDANANALAKGFPLPVPKTPNHIRIRDGKTGQSATLLRDDRILVRCLLGLTDGRRILVQVLDEPEILSIDDVLLTVRTLSYENKTMSKPIDLTLNRDCTIQKLHQILIKNYFPSLIESEIAAEGSSTPEANIIDIAKAFSTGPPLSLKTTSKLKWADPAVLAEWTSTIDLPPLSLRDGSVVVVRSRVDYEKARAAAKAKKDTDDSPVTSVNVPVGAGVAAVKAKSNGGIARIRAASSQGKRQKEVGITIEVLSCPMKFPQVNPPSSSSSADDETKTEYPPSPTKQ